VLAYLPRAAGNVGSARVEEVLPILQVKNRVSAVGLLVVVGRNVDDQIPLVRQIVAGKAGMEAETGMRRCLARREQALGQVRQAVSSE